MAIQKISTRSSLIASLEQLLLMSASSIEGTDAGEWLSGDECHHDFHAGGGDDAIYAPFGFNTIDGGSGEDTLVIYEGNRADYTVERSESGVVSVEGPGLNSLRFHSVLRNVERIVFNDGILWIDGSNGFQSINGDAADNFIAGTEKNDIINAGGGDDEIYDPHGNNVIDGGDGVDTLVVYEGNRADYDVSVQDDGSVKITGPGMYGTTVENVLRNVERISFNDQVLELTVAVDTSSPAKPVETVSDGELNAGGPSEPEVASAEPPVAEQSDTAGDDVSAEQPAELSDASSDAFNEPVAEVTLESPVAEELAAEESAVEEPPVFEDVVSEDPADVSPEDSVAASPEITPEPVPEPPVANVEPPDSEEPPAVAQEVVPEPVAEVPQLTPQQAQANEYIAKVVELTNVIRQEFGLEVFTENSQLQQAAQTQSENLAFLDFFNHTGLDGKHPWDRVADTGYNYWTVGENIAAGQLTPEEVVQAWMDSPPHRAAILNPDFKEIGVGFQYLADDTGDINYNFYWTQVFGTQM